ncbi:unnamed protein product [Boreogadus saida]
MCTVINEQPGSVGCKCFRGPISLLLFCFIFVCFYFVDVFFDKSKKVLLSSFYQFSKIVAYCKQLLREANTMFLYLLD